MANKSRAGADGKGLLLRQTAALKVRQPKQKETRQARQFLSVGCESNPSCLPFNQPGAEEIFQLFDLPAVLTLPDGIALRRLHDAAGRANLQKRLEPIQRQAAFGKEFFEHDWLVQLPTECELSSYQSGRNWS